MHPPEKKTAFFKAANWKISYMKTYSADCRVSIKLEITRFIKCSFNWWIYRQIFSKWFILFRTSLKINGSNGILAIIMSINIYQFISSSRPVRDLLETHQRPTCLIGDLDMLNRRLTCPIGDRHPWSETYRKPSYPIGDRYVRGDQSETNMLAESNRNLKHIWI